MSTQYDNFATDYEWLCSDRVLTDGPGAEGLDPLLQTLAPDAAILDCACGTGRLVLALARRGYHAEGSDASAGMIAQAKRHAEEAGLAVPFAASSWQDLPGRFEPRFDLVLCCGNAIGHCQDEDEMLRSLQAIRQVMKSGGQLILDSRNWEKMLTERTRFTTLGLRVRQDKRCIPVYVWTYPERPGQPALVEVVFIFEQDGKVWLRSYPIEYYPFRAEQLRQLLAQAGFCDIAVRCEADETWYRFRARCA